MSIFNLFSNKYNKSDDAKPSTQSNIDSLEREFQINLPNDYKNFLLNYGNIWTPDIVDLIVDEDLDLNDVQQFWDIKSIINDKKNEWTSQVSLDIIPFASDCMGNIFAFSSKDLQQKKEIADVYFFDHDFDTVEKIADSFINWIDRFNKI